MNSQDQLQNDMRNAAISAAVTALINATFEIIRTHMNKPEGWKPTVDEWNDLLNLVNLATPENEKAAARVRLGIEG